MKIGVARVSTRDQHPEAQEDALRAAGCEVVFTDKASGKLARRPELDKALMVAREGDQIVVTKLDRLGRSLENLIELAKQLRERGVDLVVLDQGVDTSTAIGRMFFQILGAVAEFEHALMSERTMDGLAAARARGRTGGQKPKLGPRQVQLAQEMYDSGDHTVQQIADEFGVSRPTIYRYLTVTAATAVNPDRKPVTPKTGRSTTNSALRNSHDSGNGRRAHPARTREEITEPVTKLVSPSPSPASATAPKQPFDGSHHPVTESPAGAWRAEPARDQAPTGSALEEDAEWEKRLAAEEERQFTAALKPAPKFGEGYQMARWPGTGRYYLVNEGERIGHAVKAALSTQWEAYTGIGSKVPGTYKTRRDALIQVALHHQHTTRRSNKRHR